MSDTAPLGPQAGAGSADANLKNIKRDVEDTVHVAVERGQGFASAVREHALNFAEDQKVEVARSVSGFAQSLRDSGKSFDDRPNIQAFFLSAAEGLDDLADSVEARSFGELYGDAEKYARRSPVAVAVATFAAGLLFARFIKSSSPRGGIDDRGRT